MFFFFQQVGSDDNSARLVELGPLPIESFRQLVPLAVPGNSPAHAEMRPLEGGFWQLYPRKPRVLQRMPQWTFRPSLLFP